MKRLRLVHESLTRSVIGAFYEVYNTLGFGFLEHIYILALERELRSRGHRVRREAGVCVMYKVKELAYQRLDMIVDDILIVEVKSTAELHRVPTVGFTITYARRISKLDCSSTLAPSQSCIDRITASSSRSDESASSDESEQPFV